MKRAAKIFAVTLACGILHAAPASAALLVYYDFNNTSTLQSGAISTFNTTGTTEIYNATNKTISIGSAGVKASSAVLDLSSYGNMTGPIGANTNWGAYFGTTNNSYGGAAAGGALSLGSGLNNAYLVLSLDTAGYRDLIVSFSTRSSASSGASGILWEVSSDGVNYLSAGSVSLSQNDTFTAGSIDLSAYNLIENVSTAYIRFAFTGATGSGNVRMDNLQINATAIPEPTTAALVLGGLGLVLLRRKRLA